MKQMSRRCNLRRQIRAITRCGDQPEKLSQHISCDGQGTSQLRTCNAENVMIYGVEGSCCCKIMRTIVSVLGFLARGSLWEHLE